MDSGGGWHSCGIQGANQERDAMVWEIIVATELECLGGGAFEMRLRSWKCEP